MGYPKVVRDEVKAVADQIVELANLGIDPSEQALPRMRPRLLAVVLVVPPPHLL